VGYATVSGEGDEDWCSEIGSEEVGHEGRPEETVSEEGDGQNARQDGSVRAFGAEE
jgi:hypothetical protein